MALLYIVGEMEDFLPLIFGASLSLSNTSSSSVVLGEALPENHELHHHHVVVLSEFFPQLILSPCWIKKEEMSPGCTCVERGGTVVRCLDRIRP